MAKVIGEPPVELLYQLKPVTPEFPVAVSVTLPAPQRVLAGALVTIGLLYPTETMLLFTDEPQLTTAL